MQDGKRRKSEARTSDEKKGGRGKGESAKSSTLLISKLSILNLHHSGAGGGGKEVGKHCSKKSVEEVERKKIFQIQSSPPYKPLQQTKLKKEKKIQAEPIHYACGGGNGGK